MRYSNFSLVGAVLLVALLGGCSGGSSPVSPLEPESSSVTERGKSIEWSPIGPIFSYGYSGKLNAFVYARSNPSHMLVAGGWGNTPRESPSQAGIFKSTDGGLHWEPSDNGLTNDDGTISSVVNGLWLDQSNPSIVLAATEFGGTFRSTDGGASWKRVDTSESTQFAQVGSTLYLATRRGVLISTDAGSSWNVSLPSSPGATSVVTAGGTTFAGDASGNVYRLNGKTWSLVGHAGTGAIHNIAIDPFNSTIVYANVDDKGAWNQNLYGSIDGGKTWTRVFCHCEVGAQAIAFSLVVPDRLYLGDDGGGAIYYFTADGSSRPTIYRGGHTKGSDVRYILPHLASGSKTEVCYFVSDQGLFYDASCTSGPAIGMSSGIPNFLAYDVSLPPDARNMVVPLQDWNAVAGSPNGSVHFLRVSEGGESFSNPYDASSCYVAHPDEGLLISTNGCATFTPPRGRGIESLAFQPPRGQKIYAITHDDRNRGRVSASTDGGFSWRVAFRGFEDPYQVAVSANNPNALLVATGTPSTPNFVYFSHDGGDTWRKATGLPQAIPLIEQYFPAHQFYAAFDPGDPGAVLLADHDPVTNDVLVFRSSNNGRSFTHVSTLVQPPTQRPWPDFKVPLDDGRVDRRAHYYAMRFYANRLAFDPQPARGCRSSVVLTTRFGAFQSFDAGTSWRRIDSSAIPHHFIGATWIDGAVYLASFGGGVIKSADLGGC